MQRFLLLYLKRLKSILKRRMLLKLTRWLAGKLQTSCRCDSPRLVRVWCPRLLSGLGRWPAVLKAMASTSDMSRGLSRVTGKCLFFSPPTESHKGGKTQDRYQHPEAEREAEPAAQSGEGQSFPRFFLGYPTSPTLFPFRNQHVGQLPYTINPKLSLEVRCLAHCL